VEEAESEEQLLVLLRSVAARKLLVGDSVVEPLHVRFQSLTERTTRLKLINHRNSKYSPAIIRVVLQKFSDQITINVIVNQMCIT